MKDHVRFATCKNSWDAVNRCSDLHKRNVLITCSGDINGRRCWIWPNGSRWSYSALRTKKQNCVRKSAWWQVSFGFRPQVPSLILESACLIIYYLWELTKLTIAQICGMDRNLLCIIGCFFFSEILETWGTLRLLWRIFLNILHFWKLGNKRKWIVLQRIAQSNFWQKRWRSWRRWRNKRRWRGGGRRWRTSKKAGKIRVRVFCFIFHQLRNILVSITPLPQFFSTH